MKIRNISKKAVAASVLAAGTVLTMSNAGAFTVINGIVRNANQIGFQVNQTSFTDPDANNNNAADTNFPSATGAAMAVWKGATEWNSELRGGNGNGDPHQVGNLGSGNSNFDFMYQGVVTSNGGQNSNVVFATSSLLGAGTFAVTSFTIPGAGWSMAFDNSGSNNWNWQDGPTNETGSNRVDIQGIATHEFGHALGLGHSGDGSATMFASTTPGGSVGGRSIVADDINGEISIYGAKSGSKPKITNVTGNIYSLGFITITGTGFSATNNEIWFSKAYGGSPEANSPPTPVIVSGISATGGTSISVQVPTGVVAGDIIVRIPGANGTQSLKSAPFPFRLQPPPPFPVVSSVSPTSIPAAALPAPVLTINGINFSTATSVQVGTRVYPTGKFTIVNSQLITVAFNPPLNESGSVDVSVTNPSGTSPGFPVNVTLPTSTFLFTDKINPASGTNVTFYCVGPVPGNFPAIAYSSCLQPFPIPPYFTLGIGGCFDVGFLEGTPLLGSSGVAEQTVTVPIDFHGIVFTQYVRIDLAVAPPWPVSNIVTLFVP